MDVLDLAYTAGLMDGEGTVTLIKSHSTDRYRYPNVSITSTTHELIEFLVDNFGGLARAQKTYKEHHKQSWSWLIRGDKAIEMLELLVPYMKEPEKIRRANLIIEKYKSVTPRNGRYSTEMHLAKLAFEAEFFSGNNKLHDQNEYLFQQQAV